MFKDKYSKHYTGLKKSLNKRKILNKEQVKTSNTVLINFGFANELVNTYLDKEMIRNFIDINEKLKEYKKIFFIDEHSKESPEFLFFKEHGIKKIDLIEDFSPYKNEKSILIPKNSSNGFVSPGFSKWLELNKNDIRNFILIGVSIDIDILQFALTLKAFFNQWNALSEIIIPIKAVESINIEKKEKDLEIAKINSLHLLELNGITLISDII